MTCNSACIGNHSVYVCEFLIVVTCDPTCVQGACVANDTCNCAEGYTGESCAEPGTYEYLLFGAA